MSEKEAMSRIKINRLLEESGWRFFDDKNGKANICLEKTIKMSKRFFEDFGKDFEEAKYGYVDFLLLDDRGFGIKNVALIKFYRDSKAINYFIKEHLNTDLFNKHYQNQSALNKIPIPLPSLEVQQEIVAKIEEERKAVEGCKELIKIYEEKIKNAVDKVWE